MSDSLTDNEFRTKHENNLKEAINREIRKKITLERRDSSG